MTLGISTRTRTLWRCHLFGVIVRLKVVFRKTVVGDWRFDYLSSSHLQSQMKSRCQMMVFMPVVLVLIGQFNMLLCRWGSLCEQSILGAEWRHWWRIACACVRMRTTWLCVQGHCSIKIEMVSWLVPSQAERSIAMLQQSTAMQNPK